MLEQRGRDRGSIITGSSVHNCRVERAHRQIYSGLLFSLQEHLLAWRIMDSSIPSMSCTYLHYITHSCPGLISPCRNLKGSGKTIPYLLFIYVRLGCLKMNTVDMLQLQMCLIQAACMIMDLIPQAHSPWKKKTSWHKN